MDTSYSMHNSKCTDGGNDIMHKYRSQGSYQAGGMWERDGEGNNLDRKKTNKHQQQTVHQNNTGSCETGNEQWGEVRERWGGGGV